MSDIRPTLRNLRPRLPELYKIKIGAKGGERKSKYGKSFQPPQKLDYFRIATMTRGPDGNFMESQEAVRLYGERPRELPIYFLYNEVGLNFQSGYQCWQGAGDLICYGDGENCRRLRSKNPKNYEVLLGECPCERSDPAYKGDPKCRMTGKLSVVLDGLGALGGVAIFRTRGFNSVVGVHSSLDYIGSITHGQFTGIPFWLTVNPRMARTPDGKPTTIQVVGIEFRGTVPELRKLAYEQRQQDAALLMQIESIEKRMYASMDNPLGGDDETPGDVVEEFFPEEAAKAMANGEEIGAAETVRLRKAHYPEDPEWKSAGVSREQFDALVNGVPVERLDDAKARAAEISGYDDLTFLRANEADLLIGEFLPEDTEGEGEPDSAEEPPPYRGKVDLGKKGGDDDSA